MASYDELDSVEPCIRLKDGFVLKDLLKMSQTEFEIQPESDDEEGDYKRLDSIFKFEDLQPFLNLDCLDVGNEDGNDNNLAVPFEKLRSKMQNVTSDGKVMKLVKNFGSGPVVPPDAAVYIHYSSYLENDEVPFDVSFLRNKRPVRLMLGQGGLIAGMDIGIKTMRKKEKSQFLIHPDFAYGKMGCPPRIPGDETILIEVELIDFVDCGGADAEDPDASMSEKKNFDDVMKIIQSNLNLGTDLFKNKNYKAAAFRYRKSVRFLHSIKLNNDEEEEKQKKLLMKAYTNLCICYNRPDYRHPERVCSSAAEAMKYCTKLAKQNAKLHFNWGRALLLLSDFENSLKHLTTAMHLFPNCPEIRNELTELEKRMLSYKQTTIVSCQKAFGNNPANICPKEEMLNVQIDRDTLRKQLDKFIKGDSMQFSLPTGLTTYEEEACQEIGESMGLEVRIRGPPGKKNVIFIKKY